MIETERLRFRRWRIKDARAYQALTREPAVARTLGTPPTLARARAIIATQNATLDAAGFCFWPLELKADGRLAGWCGVKFGPDHTPIAGEPEIGWTLHPDLHGQGYAREAATAVLAWFWAHTERPRLFAITTPGNRASWGLMERLGMVRVPGGDFNHPALEEGDPLRRHLTYVIARP
jgi:RimJ/RimL family protein N-acetyltransferase